MKKNDQLSKLALMGLLSGCLVSTPVFADDNKGNDDESGVSAGILLSGGGCPGSDNRRRYTADAETYNNAPNYYADADQQQQGNLTEDQLLSQLNERGKALYNSLDKEGKALALKLANQSCKGQNDCKGLNSCKSDKNNCAGQGSCRGTSPGPFTDKNLAVKVAAKRMAEKRGAASGSYNNNSGSSYNNGSNSGNYNNGSRY